jgi:hypothetical protein
MSSKPKKEYHAYRNWLYDGRASSSVPRSFSRRIHTWWYVCKVQLNWNTAREKTFNYEPNNGLVFFEKASKKKSMVKYNQKHRNIRYSVLVTFLSRNDACNHEEPRVREDICPCLKFRSHHHQNLLFHYIWGIACKTL